METNKLCEMSARYEKSRIRLLKGKLLKHPQSYYIEVLPGCIYQTSPMETLLINFDRKMSKRKVMGF